MPTNTTDFKFSTAVSIDIERPRRKSICEFEEHELTEYFLNMYSEYSDCMKRESIFEFINSVDHALRYYIHELNLLGKIPYTQRLMSIKSHSELHYTINFCFVQYLGKRTFYSFDINSQLSERLDIIQAEIDFDILMSKNKIKEQIYGN